jgi:hypothetical protein
VVSETYAELAPFQPDRGAEPLERRYTNEASSFLERRGARVYYRDEGPRDGPVLVALHRASSSLHTRNGWAEHLTEEVRLVRLDVPGFGLTGPRDGRQTLRNLVRTVGAPCDELGLERVAVAGNSLGGAAWRLAVERPDLVERPRPTAWGRCPLVPVTDALSVACWVDNPATRCDSVVIIYLIFSPCVETLNNTYHIIRERRMRETVQHGRSRGGCDTVYHRAWRVGARGGDVRREGVAPVERGGQ